MEEIQTKVLSVFFLSFHSHLYSLALRLLFFQTHTQPLTVSTVQFTEFSYCTLSRRKEENLIEKHTHTPFHTEISSLRTQDYARKPQRNSTFMNLASELFIWDNFFIHVWYISHQISPDQEEIADICLLRGPSIFWSCSQVLLSCMLSVWSFIHILRL